MSIVTLLGNGIGDSPSAWRKVADGSSESICLSYGSLDGGQISIELKSGDNIDLGTPIGTLGNPVGEVGEERTIRIVGPAVYRVRRKGSLSVGAVVLYDDAYNALSQTPGTVLVFDPSDLTTLFQDSAGTIPVTGMEQPVGLMLDKSKGLVRGPELYANAGFTAGASGWVSTTAGFTVPSSGVASIRATGGQCLVYQSVLGAADSWYELKFDVLTTDGVGVLMCFISGDFGQVTVPNTVGPKRIIARRSGNTNAGLNLSAGIATFGGLSCRALSGYHATQPTLAQRPILTARKNLLLNTPLVGGTAGIVGAGAVAPTGWAFGFAGGRVSYQAGAVLFTTAVNTERPFLSQTPSLTANTTYCASSRVLATGGTLRIIDLIQWVNVPVGTSAVSYLCNGAPVAATYVPVAGDVIAAVVTVAATAGTAQFRFGPGASGGGSFGTVTLTTPQVETSLITTRYQWVKTATDYDYVGFPVGLKCDGVDDGMVTGSIDFTGTDKMFVCAGVRKLSDAATGAVAELGAESSIVNGSFGLFAPSSSGANSYRYQARGTNTQGSGIGVFAAAPNSAVLSATSDIAAPRCELFKDGISMVPSLGSLGTGNYGKHPLYLFRRGGVSLPFNGIFYGLVLGGAAYSAATLDAVEQEMLGKVAP